MYFPLEDTDPLERFPFSEYYKPASSYLYGLLELGFLHCNINSTGFHTVKALGLY
jgi:hypothetical protein